MTLSAVSEDVVALTTSDNDFSGGELRSAVTEALSAAGYGPWSDFEAEIYTYGPRRLIIARPVPPLVRRLQHPAPRLRRHV